MADYIREIIYLKRIERGVPMKKGGYVRMEVRNRQLFIYVMIGEGNQSENMPVYLLYQKEKELHADRLGFMGRTQVWEISISPADFSADILRDSVDFREIVGVLIGRQEAYSVGTCARYGQEILYDRIAFPPANDQEKNDEEETRGTETGRASAEETAPLQAASEPVETEETVKIAKTEKRAEEVPEPVSAKSVRDPFLSRLQEMYPFEDDEMEWCVQMEPSDFSSFPMEFWHYGKNSFLLQGFYNYRHLLYAHSRDKNYVGVPGQFHRREQYLAGRFGFPRFKGVQKKTVKMGDYGYWLKEL